MVGIESVINKLKEFIFWGILFNVLQLRIPFSAQGDNIHWDKLSFQSRNLGLSPIDQEMQ
jgi:hypothetical protein